MCAFLVGFLLGFGAQSVWAWQNPSGAPPQGGGILQTDAFGNVLLPLADPATGMHIGGSSATSKTLTVYNTKSLGATQVDIKAGSSQGTNPLLRWLNNAGTVLGVIDSAGKMGIGISSPSSKLHINLGDNGAETIGFNDVTNGFGEVNFMDQTSGNLKWTFGVNSDSNSSDPQNSFYIFQARDKNETAVDSYRLLVNNSGNVGIGTQNPGAKLEVDGGVKFNTTDSRPTCNSNNRGIIWFTRSPSGVKDKFAVCAKDANDDTNAYAWRTLY